MVMTATRRRVTDKTEVKEVPLSLIDLSPVNKLLDPLPGPVLESLSALISQGNMLDYHIFMVREKARRNGSKRRYELISEDECFSAAKAVRRPTVKVIVMNDVTDAQAAFLIAIRRQYHPRLSPLSQARFGRYVQHHLGLTLATAAALLRMSERTLDRRVRYLSLEKYVLDLIANNQLKPGHVEELLRLKTPKEQRDAANETVRSSLTVEQLRDYLYPDHRQAAPEEIARDVSTSKSQPSDEEESTPQELLRQIDQLVEQVAMAFPSVCVADKPALDQQIGSIIERLQGIQANPAAPF